MSVREFFRRQSDPRTPEPGSRRWMWRGMETHYQDRVALHGGMEGLTAPAFACKFNVERLCGHLLAVAGEDGSVRLLDTRKMLSSSFVRELDCYHNSIFDISWVAGGDKLLTASGNCSVGLWEAESGVSLGTFKFHTKSVRCVQSKRDDPNMFVSGCRGGTICVWDMRCSSAHKPANVIKSAHCPATAAAVPASKRGRKQDKGVEYGITGTLFHGGKVASAGARDGCVKLWDERRLYSHCKLPQAWQKFDSVLSSNGRTYGFSSLISDSYESSLFASCMDDIIYQYNSTGLITRPVSAFGGGEIGSFYVKSALSPDNRFLLSGSSSGSGFIWEVDRPEAPPLLLPCSAAEVTAVDWCPSMDKLVACDDVCAVELWRLQGACGGKPHAPRQAWEVRKCREYDGEGHLKAKEVLESYLAPPTTTPPCNRVRLRPTTVPTRTPLGSVNNLANMPSRPATLPAKPSAVPLTTSTATATPNRTHPTNAPLPNKKRKMSGSLLKYFKTATVSPS